MASRRLELLELVGLALHVSFAVLGLENGRRQPIPPQGQPNPIHEGNVLLGDDNLREAGNKHGSSEVDQQLEVAGIVFIGLVEAESPRAEVEVEEDEQEDGHDEQAAVGTIDADLIHLELR
mgnify:CR=1 FL=1